MDVKNIKRFMFLLDRVLIRFRKNSVSSSVHTSSAISSEVNWSCDQWFIVSYLVIM